MLVQNMSSVTQQQTIRNVKLMATHLLVPASQAIECTLKAAILIVSVLISLYTKGSYQCIW